MSRRSIRATLYAKLLGNPDPIDPKAFAYVRDIMFPDRHCVAQFLHEKGQDEQIECAKQILIQLVYELPIPMPAQLLNNILDFEDEKAGTAKGSFVERDHFVHLANLYLLGLYLFFYHPGLHKQVEDYIMALRRRNGSPEMPFAVSQTAEATRDFVRMWQLFAIGHDLGYPFEAANGPTRKSKVQAFGDLRGSVNSELATRILSRLIAFQRFASPDLEHTFSHDISRDQFRAIHAACDHDRVDAEAVEDAYTRLSAYARCPSVPGRSFLAVMAAIRPPSHTVAVLRRIGSAQPSAVLYPSGAVLNSTIMLTQANSPLRRFEPVAAEELAYAHGWPSSAKYVWCYYALTRQQLYEKLCGELVSIDVEMFHDLRKKIDERIPLSVSMISSDADFRRYSYRIYEEIRGELETSIGRTADREDVQRKIIEARSDDLVRAFSEQIDQYLRRDDTVKDLIVAALTRSRAPQGVTARCLSALDSRSSAWGKEIDEELFRKKQKMLKVAFGANWIGGIVEQRVSEAFPKNGSVDFVVDGAVNRGIKTDDRVDKLLAARHLPNGTELRRYRPTWANGKRKRNYPNFVDHGVAGGLLLAHLQKFLSEMTRPSSDRDRERTRRTLFQLALGSDPQMRADKYRFLSEAALPEAAAACYVHNLYPAWLSGDFKKFRTRLSNAPFAFLAILADSLQTWDRRALQNHAHGKIRYGASGDRFDIRIEGHSILIAEAGNRMQADVRLRELRSGLEEYLEGAASLIHVSLTEW